VRRTKKIASIASRSGTRGLWHPNGCGFRGGSNGSILAHNASEIRHLFDTGFFGRWFFIIALLWHARVPQVTSAKHSLMG